MGEIERSNAGAQRAADSLLRTVGGRTVLLRMPVGATPGDDTEQLGLAVPAFQDVELAPVLFRRARARTEEGKGALQELVVSATAVEAVVGSLGYSSASVLFAVAAGVVVDDVLLEVESASASEAFGLPYLYHVWLRGPGRLAV